MKYTAQIQQWIDTANEGIANEGQRTLFAKKLAELSAKRPPSAPLTLEEIRRVRKEVAPRTRVRTDKPKSLGLPEPVRLDLERLVLDLRKRGGTVHAAALAVQFIRDGVERCRIEMATKSRKGERTSTMTAAAEARTGKETGR